MATPKQPKQTAQNTAGVPATTSKDSRPIVRRVVKGGGKTDPNLSGSK